jgi:hypothetical protein
MVLVSAAVADTAVLGDLPDIVAMALVGPDTLDKRFQPALLPGFLLLLMMGVDRQPIKMLNLWHELQSQLTVGICRWIHLHGLCMALSWGILLPAGVLMARHLRHKDPLWFKLHRAVQMTGVTLQLAGFIFVFVGGPNNPGFAHGIIGILVFLGGISQVSCLIHRCFFGTTGL